MPLYDYQCPRCDYIQEFMADPDDLNAVCCPQCSYGMQRIVTLGRGNSMPVDCDWIGTVREVVNKNPKTQKPEDKEFLKSPTRENYKNWMKANKLRPLEDGERSLPKKTDINKFKAEQKDALKKKFNKDFAIGRSSLA